MKKPAIILLTALVAAATTFGQTTRTPSGASPDQPYIDVTTRGAVPDGVTDNYTALQQVAAEINAAGGGTVYFPPGTYRIDQYRITGGPEANGVTNITYAQCNGLTIVGPGAVIDVKGDFHRSADYHASGFTYSYSNCVMPLGLKDCENVIVDGLEIDGNVDQMTRDPGVVESYAHGVATAGCSDYALRNLYVHHFQTDGVYLGSSGTVADRDATLENVTSEHNARQGVSVIQVRDATITNCRFSHNGLTDGAYGGHAPQAGIDVEPGAAVPVMDVNTGNVLVTGCTLRNNAGPQFQSRGIDKDNITLQSCGIFQDTSTTTNTVILAVPQGTIDDCDMDVRQIVPSTGGATTTSTTIRNCRITSNYRAITDWVDTPGTTVVISGNHITGTHTAPATTQIPLLHNPATAFVNNTVTIPAAAKSTATATPICALTGIARSSGNTFQTDYVPVSGGYFYTDYGATQTVIGDTYVTGTAFRPGLKSTWDTSAPYSFDGLAPSVAFVTPAEGATLTGAANVQVSASDNVDVSAVALYADGVMVGTGTVAPYTFAWDSATVPDGSHVLTAVASDAAGHSTSTRVNVTVYNPDVTPPTIRITSPANGARVVNTISVLVSTSDDRGVVKVELYVDGKYSAASTAAPFTTRWSVVKGTHTLQCKAYDAAGNVGVSDPVTVKK